MPSKDVCPSVCPSVTVTRRYSVETAKHILKLFSQSRRHTILVFRTKRCGNIPTGTPNGGVKCSGKKNRDFRPICRFISIMKAFEWYQLQ